MEEEKFGLQDVLLDIIGGQTAFDHLTMQEREVRARDHYIEVNGQVEYNDSRSKRVPKHADFFFDKIFPKLHDYFLDEMEDNVMVICAYSYSVSFTTCSTLRPKNRVYVRMYITDINNFSYSTGKPRPTTLHVNTASQQAVSPRS